MYELYQAHGVRFRFPADWELSEQQSDHEIFITVSSPETSFWSLTLLSDQPTPEHVIESALQAFREEYDELDIYPVEAEVAGRQSVARDLEFVCLELINSAFLRAVWAGRCTALVLSQATDHELEETGEVLKAISASLEFDSGNEMEIA